MGSSGTGDVTINSWLLDGQLLYWSERELQATTTMGPQSIELNLVD
jgi:hypothetical protein